jgi:hypothetical protein
VNTVATVPDPRLIATATVPDLRLMAVARLRSGHIRPFAARKLWHPSLVA